MEMHTYGQCITLGHDMLIAPHQLTERKLTCDSRYRSIIGQLEAMIELIRREPGRNLTAELDRLLDVMMDHIGSENGYMGMVNFPQALSHCLHHQFICTKTAELRYRFSERLKVLPEDLGCLRLLWLVHIQLYDRAFEEFLAS